MGSVTKLPSIISLSFLNFFPPVSKGGKVSKEAQVSKDLI
jgi:hypothetical protein